MPPPITLTIDDLTLTRVLYLDLPIDSERVGLTEAEVTSVSWNDGRWSSGSQVNVGAAAWVVQAGDQRVVVDPLMAGDDIFHEPASAQAHQVAIGAAFAAAGHPIDSVTHVAFTHIEGIAMAAADDGVHGWRPFFPNARVLVGDTDLAAFDIELAGDVSAAGWRALFEADAVATYADGDTIVPGMRCRLTGGHNPAHSVFDLGSPVAATMLGHLALSPLHLATGPCRPQHVDPGVAWQVLCSTAADGRALIGPLWPSPGVGRWNGERFDI